MTGDYSRRTFDPHQHNDGVLMQQGRPQLDADWNEQVAIDAYRREIEARDVIGPHGAPRGNAGFGVTGLAALDFDGIDDHVVVSDNGSLARAELTAFRCEAQVVLPNDGGGGVVVSAIARLHAGEWLLDIDEEGRLTVRHPRARGDSDEGERLEALLSSDVLPRGSAHVVAVACDADQLRLFVDGTEAASADCPVDGRPHHAPRSVGGLLQHRQRVNARHFGGRLEQLRFWDSAVADPEHLLLDWSFGDARGGVVADASGNANVGMLGGGRAADQPRIVLRNLAIGPGRLYVDGILCENETLHLLDRQPDVLDAGSGKDLDGALVYIDVWKREVSYRQDQRIREVALGGPDTTLRSRVVWQVRTLPVEVDADAMDDSLEAWQALVEHARRSGRLRARREGAPDSSLNNQLYRVEVHSSTDDSVTFKWSRENASIDFVVRSVDATSDLVALEDMGRDAYALQDGDWVEFVDDALALSGTSGPLLQVADLDRGRNTAVLRGLSQAGVRLDPTRHPILRRWDQGANPTDVVDGSIAIRVGTWQELEDGVQVSFEGGEYHPGDYWLLPARTQTGDVEWPLGPDGPVARPPDGIEHHLCPLAIVTVREDGLHVSDQRRVFEPITERPQIEEVRERRERLEGSVDLDGNLSVTGSTQLYGHVTVGRLSGHLAEGIVATDQLADGAVTVEKLAPDLNLIPPGFTLLGSTTHAPQGFFNTGWSLTLEVSGWQRSIPSGSSGFLAAAVHRARLYVFTESGGVWCFDFEDDRVFEVARLEPARRDFAVGFIDHHLLVVGGTEEGSRQPTGATTELDPEGGRWLQRAPMPTPRSHVAATALGERLHVLGGRREATELATHEAYAPESDDWSTRPHLPTARSALASAAVDGVLYAVGGFRRSALRQRRRDPSGRNEAYDPASDRWSERAPLRVARGHLAAAEYRGALLVAGGERTPIVDGRDGAAFPGRETYHPSLDLWSDPAPLAGELNARPLALAVMEGTLYSVGLRTRDPDEIHIGRVLSKLYVHQRAP